MNKKAVSQKTKKQKKKRRTRKQNFLWRSFPNTKHFFGKIFFDIILRVSSEFQKNDYCIDESKEQRLIMGTFAIVQRIKQQG